MTKIVNSWNDFDPLKHVIVGRADFSVIPPEEPATSEKAHTAAVEPGHPDA